MATAAISKEYQEDRQDFINEMKENGFEASFGARDGGSTWNPDAAYVESGTAHVFPTKWREEFGINVKETDKYYLVGDETDPRQASVMKVGDEEYTVEQVLEAFAPDNVTVIFYEIRVGV